MELAIRRPATIVLLILTTALILVPTIAVTGKSYSKFDPFLFADVQQVKNRLEHRITSTQILAVLVMPIVANVLLFVPWGFLMFISLYTINRPTIQTYVLTILLGLTFAAIIEGWQYFLPSRVADVNDILWNTTGVVAGAFLGHMRLRVRFEFD